MEKKAALLAVFFLHGAEGMGQRGNKKSRFTYVKRLFCDWEYLRENALSDGNCFP
ncbi:hypothetical protein SAMN04488090_1275 [Siphonobacter aquaeclarae]|uniref:Uncharacterized protein n=1 Tax=Siphonobacter aquaeclarae TaxID=563176 RepID=A0A1G9L5Q7_9BACT|nr:hypothetical protein SAMN04488090_1275 [Siphonobacter aquaeclarae]